MFVREIFLAAAVASSGLTLTNLSLDLFARALAIDIAHGNDNDDC